MKRMSDVHQTKGSSQHTGVSARPRMMLGENTMARLLLFICDNELAFSDWSKSTAAVYQGP